jgi:HEAT repeat protein
MDNNERIAALIKSLASSDYEVREDARRQLLTLGSAGVEPLIAALREESTRISWEAASILSEIDDPRWIQPMREVLSSRNPLLGHAAVTALTTLGSQAVEIFLTELPHCHHTVQTQMLASLGKIGDQRAVTPLMRLLKTTHSATLRYMAIEALGQLGDKRSVKLIRAFENDENHHVRERVEIALERLGAVPPKKPDDTE